MSEAVEFEEFGVYKDTSETTVFFRDRLLKRSFTNPTVTIGPATKLNFKANRRNASTTIFDVLICTKGETPTDRCFLYKVDTWRPNYQTALSFSLEQTIQL